MDIETKLKLIELQEQMDSNYELCKNGKITFEEFQNRQKPLFEQKKELEK